SQRRWSGLRALRANRLPLVSERGQGSSRLPIYGRNADRADFRSVLSEGRGTWYQACVALIGPTLRGPHPWLPCPRSSPLPARRYDTWPAATAVDSVTPRLRAIALAITVLTVRA